MLGLPWLRASLEGRSTPAWRCVSPIIGLRFPSLVRVSCGLLSADGGRSVNRAKLAVLLQALGVGSTAVGAGLVHVALGLIVAGVGLVVFGVALERG